MSCQAPLEIFAGESQVWVLTVMHADTGARRSLTGATIQFQVKVAEGDPDPPLIDKATGSGVTTLDQTVGSATEGQAEIALLPADTDTPNVPVPGTYRYDVVVIFSGGDRKRVIPPSDLLIKAVVNALP